MATRNYSNTAVPNSLSGSINNTDVTTSATLLSSLVGWPNSTPFIAVLDGANAALEVVLVTSVSGSSVTFTRGYDGTTKVAHGNGASFTHDATALDYTEANSHINASQTVHGLNPGSAVVGVSDSQTLTNKTLTTPVITSMVNATHDHNTAAGGGNIPTSAVTGLTAAVAAAETTTAHAADVTALNVSIAAKAADAAVVHLAGTEAITGVKTFSALTTCSAGLAVTANPVNTVPVTATVGVRLAAGSAPFTLTASATGNAPVTLTGFTTITSIQVTAISGSNWPITARVDSGFTTGGFNIFVFDAGGTARTTTAAVHWVVYGT